LTTRGEQRRATDHQAVQEIDRRDPEEAPKPWNDPSEKLYSQRAEQRRIEAAVRWQRRGTHHSCMAFRGWPRPAAVAVSITRIALRLLDSRKWIDFLILSQILLPSATAMIIVSG
jgi:hypothetical protein